MKRLKSSEDLDSYGEKMAGKDRGRSEDDPGFYRSSSSHRSSYYKSSESGRKVLSSSTSRYDRVEDDRDTSRLVRKRSDYDLEAYERRKSYERHRDGNERGILSSSPRSGYGMDRMYRSESFSVPRRDFPKGHRSERDRSRREGSVTSWRRFAGGKDSDDGIRSDGAEVCKGSRLESEDIGKVKSPQGFRDTKSPVWSKDSGSEQSKSLEIKKSEDMPAESSGRSSEREEGELEPDPQPPSSLISDAKDEDIARFDSHRLEINSDECKVYPSKESISYVDPLGASTLGGCEEQAKYGLLENVQSAVIKNEDSHECKDTSILHEATIGSRDENETTGVREHNSHETKNMGDQLELNANCTFIDKSSSFHERKEDKVMDSEMRANDADTARSIGFGERNEIVSAEETTQSLKDKGQCLAVFPPNLLDISETNFVTENIPKNTSTCENFEKEGSSKQGFQFFSPVPMKKQERVEQSNDNKPADDKLALELSLSLPNVLLPVGCQNRYQAPSSPSQARSVQSFPSSFRTNSDGFTASMSFSGSQRFTHNPSCSLTHNAFDFEQSVGSKPLFQGMDLISLSLDENKKNEVPYLGMSSRGNGLHHSSGQTDLHQLTVEKFSKLPIVERQISFNKQLSREPNFNCSENGRDYCKDGRQLSTEIDGSLQRINSLNKNDPGLAMWADFAESTITMVVSESLPTMSRKFNDMTGQQTAYVKEFVCDIFSNKSKQWQLITLQKALRKRVDITLDSMMNVHRVLLEILVALKTGLKEYLLQKYEIPATEMAEIFLNQRCRNVSCRSLLPVDECDCKICAGLDGFCRECMCLVCSKFDMASNTCSWVGCDVCSHWCHADCGLREGHIRNGRSENGSQGITEMQFHCVACDHPSEMFGSVKEVFHNFLEVWTAENLPRELEYVRRIFCASEDVRGKQLHEIVIRMLSKLAGGADYKDVQNNMLEFFTESESLKASNNSIECRKDLPLKTHTTVNGISSPSQGNGWITPFSPNKSSRLGSSINLLPIVDSTKNEKYPRNLDLRPSPKEALFDELESIVRIKQAEGEMFQTRADDARRDAEALKRISLTKNEKIEEEYTSRIGKLRLAEAEEMRRQKLEEVQALDRTYQEYFSMKMRMETDIKDLLLKMEATRRNLPT